MLAGVGSPRSFLASSLIAGLSLDEAQAQFAVKRKWLTPYDDIREQSGDRIIMSWDIALSEAETDDYCVVLMRRLVAALSRVA